MHAPLSVKVFLLSLPLNTASGVTDLGKRQEINRDVVIVGGGASGTYAAVRLREDLNTSVVVIEPQDRLGGHVATYTVPGTNTTIDYGVQSYINYGPALDFFTRFNIETKQFINERRTPINVDITTGKLLTGYIPPNSTAFTEEFREWLAFAEQYEHLMSPGFWDFPLPEHIPPELLVPFRETAKRIGLHNALPLMFSISGTGTGGIGHDFATLSMLRYFGAPITRGVIATSLLQPVVSNSLLYHRAYDLLNDDVLLEGFIKKTERKRSGVRMVVKTKTGEVVINAKKVLWTPQPKHGGNLEVFDEDEKEADVFRKLGDTYLYIGVAHIPCIPETNQLNSLSPKAVPSNYMDSRAAPYSVAISPTGPLGLGLFRSMLTSTVPMNASGAKRLIAAEVQRAIDGGALNYTGKCEVDFKAFTDHSGVEWPQDIKSLKQGFIQKLYGLQGYRNTWWTGRVFSAETYSSNIWAFTDEVVEKLVQDLQRS
ncbi:FAD/NAD(P)-binding domain-containing protein [Sporormia fimetaria CBS 119925]|uniref:FAD/NAD(P)-binding domain-containing protein n=1 Tax=Sporormia fimetaria CBS 119925 TaxID=1340428 RepID=A0A6A6VCY5_9PLEO|nr:FAD/NAD(P)-binding domain-containing protein [Sporormia fimetaria CBS 119925]